jgi:hypothetical protein
MSTTSIDSRLGLSNLAPEDTLGATVAWHVPAGLCIPVASVTAALQAAGLPVYKASGATPKARWTELVKNHKIRRPVGRRELRSVECKHPDKSLTSYEFNVNVPSTETEKARLVPVGTMSIASLADAPPVVTWRLSVGPRDLDSGETEAEYIARQLLYSPDLAADDCLDFLNYGAQVFADVMQYSADNCHSATSMKALIKAGFEQTGGFSIASRGGFWFMPRIDGVTCPYTMAARIADVLDPATNGQVRFTRMSIPKDAQSVEGASEVVREDFLDSLRDLEEEIEELTAHKEGQNEGRRARLAGVLSRLEVYKAVWGMAGDDIETMVAKINGDLDAHDAKTSEGKSLKAIADAVDKEAAALKQEARKEEREAKIVSEIQSYLRKKDPFLSLRWQESSIETCLAQTGRYTYSSDYRGQSLDLSLRRDDLSNETTCRVAYGNMLLWSGPGPAFYDCDTITQYTQDIYAAIKALT